MPDPTPAETEERWGSVGGQLVAGALDTLFKSDAGKFVGNNAGDLITILLSTLFKLGGPIGTGFARSIAEAEDIVAPELAEMAAAAVSDSFGVDVPASAFAAKRNRGGRNQAADALGAGIVNSIKGAGGALEPSDAAAKRYLTMVLNMALEGWYQGFVFEFVSSLVPQFDIGKIESFAQLDDTLAQTLGLGRITRSVLRPIVDATVVTPLRWQTNKTYRPELLSPSDTVRQVLRGKWAREKGLEELARQGYSDDRIDALFNAQRKVFGAGDVRTFVERGHWTQEQGVAHLRDQGYDDPGAQDALRIGGLNRFEQLEGQEASALIGAYANRDIDAATFRSMLETAVSVPSERALHAELAELRRAVNVKWLSTGQVEAMVKSGVLSVRDYREAAEREGYGPEAVIALELQLRWELDKQKKIEQHRAELLAQRDAERAARAEALAARKAEVEAERALARRGAESDLERAVVRGKIGFGRLEEVYRARYDNDTVEILVSLVEDERLAYVAQQAAVDDARRRGTRRNVDVGALERAFAAHLLNPAEFNARLRDLGFEPGDAALLTATAVAAEAERVATARARDEAANRAKRRSIDLGRYEQLVRRGARTMQQYAQLLASLDFSEPAIVDLVDLLQLRINEDAAARAAREDAERTLRPKGLSLEQIRRGVLLGVVTEQQFERFLIEQNFTGDAQIVLLAELRADVAEAEAARARRDRPTPGPQAPGVPLSTIRRAAQLGVITVQTYIGRLALDGYSPDDIDLELELLLFEMAEAAAARERRDAGPPATPSPGPTLAELERAVRAGVATIDDYVARAITLGRTPADAAMLAAVLERELETLTAARRRHEQIGFELAPRGLSLKMLDEAAKSGELSFEDYVAQLAAWGYGAEDGELLAALLALSLESTPG